MFVNNRKIKFMIVTVNLALTVVIGLILNLLILKDARAGSDIRKFSKNCKVLIADRVFDGFNLHENTAVLFKNNQIVEVGANDQLSKKCKNKLDLGDSTILPGFIESHAHISVQNISSETVLRHGVTTVRETGGPLHKPLGGNGKLRILSAGPIIQPFDGYPLNIFGHGHDDADHHGKYQGVGVPVATIAEAEQVVEDLVAGGATIIKISLEPGGEEGAPWMSGHGHGEIPPTPWPMLPPDIVKAIVNKAHALNKRVTAHLSEDIGVEVALDAGVDEWAHIPCAPIREDLLQRAVVQGVVFVTTIDTLSSCTGIHGNAHTLAHIIANAEQTNSKFIYGSEIGHDNVPWGINGQEMGLMLQLTSGEEIGFPDVLKVFKAATSEAGKNLGMPHLGTLMPGAPADIIAVRGNPFERFKLLEYPDLVLSGGKIIVNNFKRSPDGDNDLNDHGE
ncbi:amidohydrolase family protein [Nitrosomonas sp.]|uniref:amidohydrolase family protein n=1 Tax=Nitrosomonas sp. TaxID=42353 RepID=UPI002087DF9D|nr:amidohydrolase family protein [Nitrosomonas sp.]GJL76221.1 MAG: amidohydrolase [Nitrosomonas sp.]